MNILPNEILHHILSFIPFKNMVRIIFVSKKFRDITTQSMWTITDYTISLRKDHQILTKFKPRIEKLIVNGLLPINCVYNRCNNQMIQIKKLDLTQINYKKLYLKNINFIGITNLIDLDLDISKKCKKISFHNLFFGFYVDLPNPLKYLTECESIHLSISLETRSFNTYFLNCTKTLPKLRKITLSHWWLDNRLLQLLSNREIIVLKTCQICGDLNLIQNYYRLHLISCTLQNVVINNQILIGKYKNNHNLNNWLFQ